MLFQCGDHADDDRVDRVCCQKRALILRLCDVILTWLKDNRDELMRLQSLQSDDWRLVCDDMLQSSNSNDDDNCDFDTDHGPKYDTKYDDDLSDEKANYDDSACDVIPSKRQRRHEAIP